MFKFNFQLEDENEANPFTKSSEVENDEAKDVQPTEQQEWYDSEEVVPSTEIFESIDVCKLNSVTKELKDVSVCYMVSGFLLEDIKKNGDNILDIKKAEENHSDLMPAIYEGGAKIWECTDDLLKYLSDNMVPADWKGKTVLDLGCGSGLLGIYAYKKGSKVTFHDYNKDVLENITIPNLLLNSMVESTDSTEDEKETLDLDKFHDNAKFYSGDWQKWSESKQSSELFDIILTSETIYNPQNQQKLLNCLHEKLKPNGQIFVAAKTYYFGVGGGLRQFEELITKDGRFSFKCVWLSNDGVNREILQLNKKVES